MSSPTETDLEVQDHALQVWAPSLAMTIQGLVAALGMLSFGPAASTGEEAWRHMVT